MKAFWLKVLEIMSPVVLFILAYYAKEWIHYWRNKSPGFAELVRRNEEVNFLLTQLMTKVCGIRAYVSRYHNGGKFVDGMHHDKKSRVYEVGEPGLENQMVNYRNVSISMVNEENKMVLADGPCFTMIDSLEDGWFRRMMIRGGAKATARCAIKRNGKIIGFIGVDWGDPARACNLDLICHYAGQVELLLQSRK